MGKNYVLIDGHGLAYRAFFALPQTLTTTEGQPTNAVYGFMNMLFKVMTEEEPDAVIVALDGPRAELKRTAEFPEYKAQRPPMPDELRSQISLIVELLEALGIPVVQLEGYEADDIIGTLSKKISDSEGQAVIVTGDRDALQLVGERVKVLLTEKGISEVKAYGVEKVIKKYGVPPEKIPDIVGLKGDPSDNIPGVPGIGDKGAQELISKFGSLEDLYENLDKIGGAKRRESIENNREMAFLSRKLAVIDRCVPIDVDLDSLRLGQWDKESVIDKMDSLEFKSLIKRFLEFTKEADHEDRTTAKETVEFEILDGTDPECRKEFQKALENEIHISVSGKTENKGYCDIQIESIAFFSGDKAIVIPFDEDDEQSIGFVKKVLSSHNEKVVHDGKGIIEALSKKGIEFSNLGFDTAIAAYLLNPSLGTYHLWNLWENNVGKRLAVRGRQYPEPEQASLLDVNQVQDVTRTASEAVNIYYLRKPLCQKLQQDAMLDLFKDIEMPLMLVLADMEKNGVAVDADILKSLSAEAQSSLEALEKEIFELVGHEFNVGSPKQLGEVLFEELGLPPVKKTKTGYSTDSSVLETLKPYHPVAEKIIEHREISKLKSTYFDVLPQLICPATGRIHCSFNQTATATGRISSSNPNLQNIPVRTELGKKIRRAFIPGEEGWKLLVADYSQIELRVLAHMSEDSLLLEAFARDADIHTETAASLFGVSTDQVTPELRRMAKVVNFGVVYGMGFYGLSSRMGMSREDAMEYINRYFQKYEGVKRYRERCIQEAAEKGYTETLLGRRRYVKELSSSNKQTRELGERLAINTPLQGTAADIIKKAMVDVSAELKMRKLKSRMILQIHDELIFEVSPDEAEELKDMVSSLMSSVLDLRVPLKVDLGIYDNWGEAK